MAHEETAFFIVFLLLPVTSFCPQAQGQRQQQLLAPDWALPVYDVVSIKPSRPNANSPSLWNNMDRYIATNVSLRRLLEDSYNVRQDLISGIPRAIDDEHFDITAKIVSSDVKVLNNLGDEQWREMRRAMLVDCFQLKAHHDQESPYL